MINALGIPLAVAVHLVGMVFVALLLRIPLYGIHYGVGPSLLRKKSGRTDLSLRLLPIGAHIQFEPPAEAMVDRKQQAGFRGPELLQPSRFSKALLYASGCCALLLFGIAVLGPSEALASLGRGFTQVLGGALDPLGRGADNVRALGRLLATAPFLVCAAILSIKMAAFNLLPLAPLNGFQILQAVLVPDAQRAWLDWAVNLGVLVLALILCSYGVALGVVLWFA